jgi:GAF domain-containing protein/anti-sigma regulatory factor (Ser/Thr protein kinase)
MPKESRKSRKALAKPVKKHHRVVQRGEDAVAREAAISDILRVISSSPSHLQPVFDTILAHTIRLCEGDVATLWQFDGKNLCFAASKNATPEAVAHSRQHPLELGTYNPTPQAALERRVVHVLDVFANPNYRPLIPAGTSGKRPNAGTVLAVPLLRENDLLGVITIWRYEKRSFSERQIELVKTFTAQAVIAIQNVRLFNETKEALEQQTATAGILRVITSSPTDLKPVMTTVVENAARLAEADHALIGQAEGANIRWLAAFGCPLPSAVRSITRDLPSGRAMLDLQTTQVEDVAQIPRDPSVERAYRELGVRSIFATPLVREGRAVGVLLLRRTEVRPFTEKQIALLTTFADQAAIAIENVRLFNETKEALERQTATADILKVISRSPTNVQPVLDAVAERAATLCGANHASVFLAHGEVVRRVATFGSHGGIGDEYPVSRTFITGRTFLEGRTTHVEDVLPLLDSEYPDARKSQERFGFRSAVSVPLLRDAKAIGVIMAWRREVQAFSAEQIGLLQTFADQAVIAIENVRLFNETKEALERQTATSEILRVISSSPADLQPVFDTILRNFMSLCGTVFGSVFTYDGELVHYAGGTGFTPERDRAHRAKYPVRVDDPSVVSARVIFTKAPVHIHDVLADPHYDPQRAATLGVRRVLGVPMLRDGIPLGALVAGWAEPSATPKHHEDLLKTFADQAVIAIENVRLFNETKEALEQQTAISEILRVISNSPADVQPVLDAVAQRAARICEASDGRIFLVEGERLRYTAGFGDVPMTTPIGYEHPLDRRLVIGRAVVDRETVHVEDLQAAADEFPLAAKLQEKTGQRTTLAVPLLRENRSLGAIMLRRMEVRPFTDKQIALLKTFADQAAIAIQNVRLFNETKEALEQQKATAEVLGAISSSIADTQPVFDKILESCTRLFGGHDSGIGLVGDDGHVYLAAHHGAHVEELQRVFPVPLSPQSGTGAAILERRVMHYPDTSQPDVPPYVRRSAQMIDFKSVVFAPMFWEDKGIGAIWVGRPFTGPFTEKQITLLKSFADQAAIAIQNARLFKEIQEKSAQLEVANKHKSDFLANMSHELRTPLNAIIGFSEALMERMFGEVNEKQADYLKDIHESGRHLLSLINDILDLSKIEAGRMDLELSSFHLPTALSNAMTLIRERAQRHGIELGLEVDQRLGEFQADERKFKQIMLNLLSNAVKFTPDGGRVDVCATRDTDKIEIAVKDTGIGIAPEDQAVVFEEFKQVGRDQLRKAEGTGLGLALTRRFVELHGGAIRLESTPGKGSTFTVSLPLRAG